MHKGIPHKSRCRATEQVAAVTWRAVDTIATKHAGVKNWDTGVHVLWCSLTKSANKCRPGNLRSKIAGPLDLG